MLLSRVVASLGISLCFWCAAYGSPAMPGVAKHEFAGSIPCDDSSREFVGGIPTNIPCHCITWDLTLSTNLNSNGRATYRLTAQYGLAGKTDPNQLEDGPVVTFEGTWEIVRGSKANPRAVVYQLYRMGHEKPISLLRVGENVLHFLSADQSLRLGNAGWSYTLNRRSASLEN